MPAVIPASGDELMAIIQKMQRQLQQLMSQPTITIADNGHTVVLQMGLLQPPSSSSTPAFGLQTFDANGNLIVQLGQQFDGTEGLNVNYSNGSVAIQLNQSGLTAYDSSGKVLLELGDVGSGIEGLAVVNPQGTLQMVSGSAFDFVPTGGTSLTPTAGQYTPLPTSPRVSAQVGPSGAMVVRLACLLDVYGSATSGLYGEVIPILSESSVPDSVQLAATGPTYLGASVAQEYYVTGLTVGSTLTATVAYGGDSNSALDIYDVFLSLTPA